MHMRTIVRMRMRLTRIRRNVNYCASNFSDFHIFMIYLYSFSVRMVFSSLEQFTNSISNEQEKLSNCTRCILSSSVTYYHNSDVFIFFFENYSDFVDSNTVKGKSDAISHIILTSIWRTKLGQNSLLASESQTNWHECLKVLKRLICPTALSSVKKCSRIENYVHLI